MESKKAALRELALRFQDFSLEELRWDWCCNITEDTRQIIHEELERRGITEKQFEQLGRGRRRGDPS